MGADRRMVYITGCQHLIKAPPQKKSPKWGGDESADTPGIPPVSFDIYPAAYYGIFLILQ